MDRAIIIVMALLLSAVISGRWLEAFAAPAGTFLRELERKLNREHRTLDERARRGTLLVVLAVAAGLLCGWVLGLVQSYMLNVVLLAVCLPVRAVWERLSAIKKHLQANNLAAARDALAGTPCRHHALLDVHGVARAAIEWQAVQFAEKILAPLFWFMLLGLPGFLASKILCLLRETLADKLFAKTADSAHRLLHFLPARLAAGLWMVAILFLPSRPWQPTASVISAGIVSPQPPYALALLCVASALNLSLGGPLSAYVPHTWIGTGTARAGHGDVARARFLYGLLCLFFAMGASLFF